MRFNKFDLLGGSITLAVVGIVAGVAILGCIQLFGLVRVALVVSGVAVGYIVRELLP